MAGLTLYGRAIAGWARKYPFAPRYRRGQRITVMTADGVRLSVVRLDGPPDAPLTVVLVHGFLNSARSPRVHAFAHVLAERVHVLVPDLRGHGRSSGACTLGLLEPLDVAATAAVARPDLPVVTVGTSLGAAAAILHAGSHDGVAGVVAISSPAFWGSADRPGSRRVLQFVRSRAGRRFAGVVMRTRIGPCDEPVTNVEELVGSIAPAFTIIVHDPDDSYFGVEHAEHLYAHAREPKDLWWYEDAGHGTDLLTSEFADRLVDELVGRVTSLRRDLLR